MIDELDENNITIFINKIIIVPPKFNEKLNVKSLMEKTKKLFE